MLNCLISSLPIIYSGIMEVVKHTHTHTHTCNILLHRICFKNFFKLLYWNVVFVCVCVCPKYLLQDISWSQNILSAMLLEFLSQSHDKFMILQDRVQWLSNVTKNTKRIPLNTCPVLNTFCPGHKLNVILWKYFVSKQNNVFILNHVLYSKCTWLFSLFLTSVLEINEAQWSI